MLNNHHSENMPNRIEIKDLCIGYGAKPKNVKTIASDLNGCLCEGQLTCLLGANGVGKSTLLKTLSGFLPKLGGNILIADKDIKEYSDKQLARLIGVVLTSKPDIQNMSAREMVALGRSPYTGFWGSLGDEDNRIVDKALEMVGISELGKRMIDTLSDGERQKMMIAKALAQQTPVIYLDEPTAFLDFPSKVEMMRLLRSLARETGKIIFLSTHDVSMALQIADNVWLMEKQGDNSRTLTIGSPHALAENGTLPRFIEGEGIFFDRTTLTIRIE